MASILVVCTGNVCRSPIAEGVIRSLLERRFGEAAPDVASAGTRGWEGSPAHPDSIVAAAELGVDISRHLGRRVTGEQLEESDLVLAMSAEHRDEIAWTGPRASSRTFTIKELVRLLEALPAPAGEPAPGRRLAARVVEADGLRRTGFEGNRRDEDVADPLGMSLETFRAVAMELEAWSERLVDGLFGPVPAQVEAEGA